jgi:hypothetical protein
MLTLAKVVEVRIRNSKRPLLLQFVATWAFLILKTDRVFNIILSMVYQDRLGPDVTTRKLKEGACRGVLQLADATLYSENEQLDNL